MNCENHLKPNHLLVLSSSLFCVPMLSVFLNDKDTFQKNKKELFFLIAVSIASIVRWGNPCVFTRKLDKYLANITFFYFHTMFCLHRSPLHGLLSACLTGTLFQLSRLSRKKWSFKYWYIFHVSFHILANYNMTKLYYKTPFFPKVTKHTSSFSPLQSSSLLTVK